jgi:hypothetical protein
MPLPIRPINDTPRSEDRGDSGYFMMDADLLSKSVAAGGWITKQADVSDEEAKLLFELWQKSASIDESEKKYRIPDAYPNDDILRLKTSNLIVGDGNIVKLTPKAVGVIRTMVLGEQNKFGADAQKKPYSQILADSKLPKKTSNLAFASAIDLTGDATDGVNLSVNAQMNVPLPPEKIPTSSTEYIYSWRGTYSEGTSNKQYIVRVYRYPDGTFSVVAYNGRIGKGLAVQPKGLYIDEHTARGIANNIVVEKRGKGYIAAADNMQAPGRSAESRAERPELPRRSLPAATPRPAPAPAKPAPAKPKEQKINIEEVLRGIKPTETEVEDTDGGFYL